MKEPQGAHLMRKKQAPRPRHNLCGTAVARGCCEGETVTVRVLSQHAQRALRLRERVEERV
jgi:hypothetical protein